MRSFPVVNLGQVRVFGPLNPETLSRICEAVDAYNGADSSPEGQRTQRDAVADVRSILGPMSLTDKRASAAQMWFVCNNPTPLLSNIMPPEPPQYPFFTPTPQPPPVMTIEPLRQPTKMTPTGDRGPGYGAFRGQGYPSVATTGTPPPQQPITYEPVPTGTTGSEPELPPPPIMGPPGGPYIPPPTLPPPVATEGAACYYVIGQGYSWGARPSGGETTGLNQRDCESIQARYNDVRGLPNVTSQGGQTAQNVTNPQPQQTSEGLYNPNAPMAPQGNAPVASTDCSYLGPNAYWDGRQCRSANMTAAAGSLVSQAMNLGPSGGGLPAGSVPFGGEGFGSGGAPGAFSMAGRRRFPVVNL